VAAAAFSGLGTAIALLLPNDAPAAAVPASDTDDAAPEAGAPPAKPTGLHRWLHPAGLGPGVVLALGAAGYAGFASFVPLYVDEIGLEGAGVVFFEYGILVLAVRILASRLPDVLGSRRGPAVALTLQATGLLLMGLLASPAGLYGSTAIYAAGVSLLYPSLFIAVVDCAPAEERSQSIATFTLFFDLSQGLGAPLLGVLVSLTENRGAFVGASALSAIGLVVHRRVVPAATGPAVEVCPPPEPGA
jgi:MFS family permease